MLAKRCLQCGRQLPAEMFIKYAPRGAGIRNTTQGRHTICKECESFNNGMTRIWKTPAEQRSDTQTKVLVQAADFYKELHARGLHPTGAYARHVLEEGMSPNAPGDCTAKLKYMQTVAPAISTDIVADFKKLLEIEMTEEPDVYQDMLDKLVDTCADSFGKVLSQYKDIFNQVSTRFDNYEDNYKWD